MKYYAIGDVGGYLEPLRETLGELDRRMSPGDKLVFFGNCIGDGPDPLGVLRLVRARCASEENATQLLGDEDESFLEWVSHDVSDADPIWASPADDFRRLRRLLPWEALAPLIVESFGPYYQSKSSIRMGHPVKRELWHRYNALFRWLDGIDYTLTTDRLVFTRPHESVIHDECGHFLGRTTSIRDHLLDGSGNAVRALVFGRFQTLTGMHLQHVRYRGLRMNGVVVYVLEGTVDRTGQIPVLVHDNETGDSGTLFRDEHGAWREEPVAVGSF